MGTWYSSVNVPLDKLSVILEMTFQPITRLVQKTSLNQSLGWHQQNKYNNNQFGSGLQSYTEIE